MLVLKRPRGYRKHNTALKYSDGYQLADEPLVHQLVLGNILILCFSNSKFTHLRA